MSRSRSPVSSITVSSHSGSGSRPAIDSGSSMFSRAVEHRQQVEELEDEADVVPAQPGQRVVAEVRDLGALIFTEPSVGLSRPARMCISVDLPDPDGPITAVSLPALDLDRDTAQRGDGGIALTVAPGHVRRRRRPAPHRLLAAAPAAPLPTLARALTTRVHRLAPVRQIVMLRGINLGPNRRVPMAELRKLFTEAGYEDVRTYVQSGNIVLGSDAKPAELEREARALISERFGFEVPVIVRTQAELATVVSATRWARGRQSQALPGELPVRQPDAGVVERLSELAAEPEALVDPRPRDLRLAPRGRRPLEAVERLAGKGLASWPRRATGPRSRRCSRWPAADGSGQ